MQDLKRTAKFIADLDSLIRGLRESLPSIKPHQRQLRADLEAVDSALQVLRMAIVMDRPVDELAQASRTVHDDLRRAQLHASKARHAMDTRQVLQLSSRLAHEILASLTAATTT